MIGKILFIIAIGLATIAAPVFAQDQVDTAPPAEEPAPESAPAPQTDTVEQSSGAWNSPWASKSLWDDGLAEVAIYEARKTHYGQQRDFEAYTILVKESFAEETMTKAENRDESETLEVFKFNHVIEFQTGIYDYRQMMSIFLERDEFTRPVKVSFGSQEWCGNTYLQINRKGDVGKLTGHSYWDLRGEGDLPGDTVTEFAMGADVVLRDELPVRLRAMIAEDPMPAEREVSLIGTLISSKVKLPRATPAKLVFSDAGAIETVLGKQPAVKVEVEMEEGGDVYWFAKGYPHIMLRWESSEGTRYLIRKVQRIDYWNKTKPGGERYLK